MSGSTNAADRCPEPTLLALEPTLAALVDELNSLVAQLDRLYEQRHFELQQKYGRQSFLDFQRHQPQHRDGFKPEESPPSK